MTSQARTLRHDDPEPDESGHAHLCLDCDVVIERGDFDCARDEDHDFAVCEYCIAEEIISATFAREYRERSGDSDDAASAIENAREVASRRVPAWMTGTFDDETLSFSADRP